MKKLILITLILGILFISFGFVFSQKKIEINFFYSLSCPHCAKEEKFLDEIEKKYPEIQINRYSIEDSKNVELLKKFCERCAADDYFGLVPMTFIGDEFFLGFDDQGGIGKNIEDAILKYLKNEESPTEGGDNKLILPIVGEIDPRFYSLPVLAILLGFLDGFNVCSLWALILILSLVLALRSKRKAFITGGVFLMTTAIVYGILIFFWYQLFSLLSHYLKAIQFLVGLLAMGGGIYFLRQYFKFKKAGPICEIKESKIAKKITRKLQDSIQKSTSILTILGSVLVFALVITIVEFPCSAAVPVVFAGILAQAKLPMFLYLSYLVLFLIFYLLDEIIIFLVAVFSMKLWVTSPKLTLWFSLIGAVILFLLGFYYIFNIF